MEAGKEVTANLATAEVAKGEIEVVETAVATLEAVG